MIRSLLFAVSPGIILGSGIYLVIHGVQNNTTLYIFIGGIGLAFALRDIIISAVRDTK